MRWYWLPLLLLPLFPLEARAGLISGRANIDIRFMGNWDPELEPPFCSEEELGIPCGLGHIDFTELNGKLQTYHFYSDDFPTFNSTGQAHDYVTNALNSGVPTYNVNKNGLAGLDAWQLSHPTGVDYFDSIETGFFPPTYLLIAETPLADIRFVDFITNSFSPGSDGRWETGEPNFDQGTLRTFTVLSVEGLPSPVPEPSGLDLLASACALWFGFTVANRRRSR